MGRTDLERDSCTCRWRAGGGTKFGASWSVLVSLQSKKKRFNQSWTKQKFTRFPASHLDGWGRILVRESSDLVTSCDYFIWSSNFPFPVQHIRFGKSLRGIFNMQKKLTCCHSGPPKSQDDLLSVQLVVPQYSYVPIKSALPQHRPHLSSSPDMSTGVL